jgi:uncharacterized membrane protein YfcA
MDIKFVTSILGIFIILASALLIQSYYTNTMGYIPEFIFNNAKIMGIFSIPIGIIGIILGIHYVNRIDNTIIRYLMIGCGVIIIALSIINGIGKISNIFETMPFIILALLGIVIFDYGARMKIAVPLVKIIKMW